MSTLSIMAPAIIDTASNWSNLGKFNWILIKNIVIFIVGFIGCVLGTYVGKLLILQSEIYTIIPCHQIFLDKNEKVLGTKIYFCSKFFLSRTLQKILPCTIFFKKSSVKVGLVSKTYLPSPLDGLGLAT